MTTQEFYSLRYEEQWYRLIDFIHSQYAHKPFLYWALNEVTNAYKHNYPFSEKMLKDLHYIDFN